MRLKTGGSLVAVGVLCTIAVIAPLALAAPNSPELQYLQSTIKPALDTIQSMIGSVGATLSDVWSFTSSTKQTVDALPKLAVVSERFTSMPNSTTGINFDVKAKPQLFGRIRRYTVTMAVFNQPVVPGVDTVRIVDGVWDGTAFNDVLVASFDPATQSTIVTAPYAGGNSFVNVIRGADGSGPIDVVVNAYVEAQP